MTNIVRVRSKDTGNVFEIDEANVNDTVEVVDATEVELTEGTPTGNPVEFVEVRSKETGNVFTIDRENLNDTVEIVNDELPAGAPDDSWTRAQLDLYAGRNSVDVSEAKTKADVLDAINTPQTPEGAPPPDGNVG